MKALALVIVMGAILCGYSHAAELRVPEQHGTIQSALDAAAAGDFILVEAGTFNENLVLKVPVTLTGAGSTATTVQGSASRGAVLQMAGISGVSLKGLRLLMGDVRKLDENAPKPSVVDVSKGSVVMEGVVVESGAACGILAEGASVTLRDCKVHLNRSHGVSLTGAEGWGHFADASFFQNGGIGALVSGGAEAEFQGCVSKENALRGYLASDGARFRAESSSAVENKLAGMVSEYAALFSIKGCRVLRNGGGGISLSGGGADSVLEDNLCEGNLRYGIYLDDAATAQVLGNRAVANAAEGILAKYDGTAPLLARNTCESNQGEGISVMQGASPQLKENICLSNGGNGIYVAGWDTTATLTGNQLNQNGMNGLFVDHTAIATMKQNTITGNKGQGLLVHVEGRADSDADEITGNAAGDRAAHDVQPPFFVFGENEVTWCLATGRFARLERLRERFVAAPVRVKYGLYGLDEFYKALFNPRPDLGLSQPERVWARLDEWAAAFPDSNLPDIARAVYHSNRGWAARGTGFSNTVTPEGWKTFKVETQKALEVLKRAEARQNVKDPHLYAIKIQFLRESGAPLDEQLASLKAGVAIQPGYQPLYYDYMYSLLPRWGGSPKAVANFLPQVIELVGPDAAPIVYGQLVSVLMNGEDLADLYAGDYGIDWAFASQGLAQITRDHPDNMRTLNSWVFSACMVKDQAQAKRAFSKIGDLYSKYVWRDRRNFDAFYAWATGAGEYPAGLVGLTKPQFK